MLKNNWINSTFFNLNIKLRMFILGSIITFSLLILLFTATYTNTEVKKDILLIENSINNNKILLSQLNLIDSIQINLSKLIRYSKDAIISKDELNIDKDKFYKIEQESIILIDNINKLKNNYIENIEKELFISEEEFIKEINDINELAILLINQIKITLQKRIEERHLKLTIIGDDLLKLETFLNDISHDLNTNLVLLENSFKRRLKNISFNSQEYSKIFNGIEIVTKLQKTQNDLILTAITSIGFSEKGYIDDKRITLINENLKKLNADIITLYNFIESQEEKDCYNSIQDLLNKLNKVINEELTISFEVNANERAKIDIDFLQIDNLISKYSDLSDFYLKNLAQKMRNIISNSNDNLTRSQNKLNLQVENSFRLSLIISIILIIIVIIFFIHFANSLVKPLLLAVNLAKGIENGDFSHRLNLKRKDEIGELAYALDDMAIQLENYTKNLSIKNKALELEILERKKIEEEVIKLNEELEERVKKRTRELELAHEELLIRERLSILGHFSGSISHELRNPLGVIDSSTYFLNMKLQDADEKIKTHLDRIKLSINKSNAIIQSLLNLARMKKPTVIKNNLVEIFEDVFNTTVPNTIKIIKKYFSKNIMIYIEKEQIYIAMKNIISNSIEAMNYKGKIFITIDKIKNNIIKIIIEDTGPGIKKETIGKIFQPLFSTKTHGIGFGLSITKMIIENHGGTIKAFSKKQKGAEFIITLPININNKRNINE